MAVTDDMPWDELLRLPLWTPLSATASAAEDLSENVKKIGEQKYLFVVDSDLSGHEENAPYITMAIWAETDGAALRAADGALEVDVELPHATPAAVLLPPGSIPEYRSILAGLRRRRDNVLESAEYRIAIDGAFLHKVIRGDKGSYFFRRNDIVAWENLRNYIPPELISAGHFYRRTIVLVS
ncbi:MAG: hypothetical protein ACJ74H_14730 [Thermoanaerobaculia bacterium]